MKIFGYTRLREVDRSGLGRDLEAAVAKNNIDWAADKAYAEFVHEATGVEIPSYGTITRADVDRGGIMMSFGGDGTFLDAVRILKGVPMPIIGVNTGRLGFLSTISMADTAPALAELAAGKYTVQKRALLEVEGDFGEVKPEFPCALNEFTLHRHTADMVEIKLWVNGQELATMRGDGAVLATPTGSTAYSMSAGGPIIEPGCDCFVFTPIAPHNFSIRPLVVPDTSTVEMEVRTRGKEVMAALDNASFIVKDGARFRIKKSKYSAFLAQLNNISFYDTLRDRVMWGLDKRDKILPLHSEQ